MKPAVGGSMLFLNNARVVINSVYAGIFDRHPKLKMVSVESGIGWIPFFLERVKWIHERHSVWAHDDLAGKTPLEGFREHFLTCFISDPLGVKLRHDIGIDNICWEADYPHSDSMWPGAPEELWDVIESNDVPDEDTNKITHENAMRWYSFDPFAHVPREQATVGALRAASADHDISVQSRSHRIIDPSEKLEAFRMRARAAQSSAPSTR